MTSSIIIIGAGAAGLQAGRLLAGAGYRVTLLEAAAQPGGRILTLSPEGFSGLVEGGAEFVHGKLPFSLRLAKEAGIALQPVKADLVRWTRESGWGGDDGEGGVSGADWGALMQAMEKLTVDVPVAGFLETHFPGERWSRLRDSVRRFAEGYDLADLRRVSTIALFKEWSGEEGEEEYRPVRGYRPMIDFLVEECRRFGAELHYSCTATAVSYQKGRVRVQTEGGRVFEAEKCVVSVSLGVLGAGMLRFDPGIPELDRAVKDLGYGTVVKILLEFAHPFWLEKKQKGHTLFILSDQPVPTWWTQTDDETRVLTGWLAGEAMRQFLPLDKDERLDRCLGSLAAIFSLDTAWLREQLTASLVLDWAGAPYVRGGYSFETVQAEWARNELWSAHGGTIFFCGEAFCLWEDAPGTVEAALVSGQDVAKEIAGRGGRG